jgi:hypothetical protein
MGPKLTKPRVIEALQRHHGVVLKAAEALGCARCTLYAFMEKHEDIKELRYETSETLKDIAEAAIIQAIKAGDLKTVRWWLERQAKDRGYTTRIEQTGADGGPLESVTKIERVIVDPAQEDDPDA